MPEENKSIRLLRLLFLLMSSYPRTREECTEFLGIGDSAFFAYCNEIKRIGFNLLQKDGRYWVEADDRPTRMLATLLHFTEEEAYILARTIDRIDGNSLPANRLKQKLVAFLNSDMAVEAYLRKAKSEIVMVLHKAIKGGKQVLLVNYASGNSQTIRNRRVEPFAFQGDFELVWAFDTELKKNRQFKVCRIEDVQATPLAWEFERLHRSTPVDLFRNTGELTKKVSFQLNLRAYNLLREEYPLSEQYLTKLGSNRFIFEGPVAKYEGPGRFVMGVFEDIQLIGDEGFLAYIQEKITRLSQP